ncbi:uncharacterized protein BCR38DRAFT_509211, partial [Pseudomassariella vexata]
MIIGPNGPLLRTDGHEHAETIRREFGNTIHPIGKLLMRRKRQEIAEYNGENGMRRWITIGIDIYDVTTFTFGSREERERLLNTPGSIVKLPEADDVRKDLLSRLFPYKCAFTEGFKGCVRNYTLPMTLRMLSWHDNPSSGLYMAIDGIV